MNGLVAFGVVFVAGVVAALGTGLGTVPLFWIRDVEATVDVALWGFAGGLMASASVFGLLFEAFKKHSALALVAGGFLAGIALVVAAHEVVERFDYEPKDIAKADAAVILNILLVLFVHSFPEGIAIGVSFAELDANTGIHLAGITLPVLAVVMTLALAIHNVPEGVAVGIPLAAQDSVSNARMFGAAVLTSVPQPVGAVVAFYFVQLASAFLGFGYGFAAGAMLYLVADDVLPEGLEAGEELPHGGRLVLTGGALLGFLAMVPLVFVL